MEKIYERKEILAWPQQKVDEVIERICVNIKNPDAINKDDNDLCKKLINYRDINTQKIAEASWEMKRFDCYVVYKNAPEHIVNAMIDLVMCDDTESSLAAALLLSLAVAGGEQVFLAFLELEKHPRKWRDGLYVNPSFYATDGGWSYDKEGNFRKTNFDQCYPMVKGTLKENSPVKIGVKTDEYCDHCGCQILNLMEIDGSDPRLAFIGIDGVIKMKCCPNCFPYLEAGYCRYEVNGESQIIPYEGIYENYVEEEEMDELIGNTYILGESAVSPRYAADWDGGSSVGGFAFWIPDCDIKMCPDCGKPMMYLAQIQWDTVSSGMEGNAYIEICKDCGIMAVLHQQT